MAFGPGDVVNNRYRILDKLGAGAHGVVYRARDLETREEVALKFLGDGKSLDPEYSRRIEREAMAMARLRGTSAVYVHGLNIAQDGSLYLVMEVLVGKDFEDYLLRQSASAAASRSRSYSSSCDRSWIRWKPRIKKASCIAT